MGLYLYEYLLPFDILLSLARCTTSFHLIINQTNRTLCTFYSTNRGNLITWVDKLIGAPGNKSPKKYLGGDQSIIDSRYRTPLNLNRVTPSLSPLIP